MNLHDEQDDVVPAAAREAALKAVQEKIRTDEPMATPLYEADLIDAALTAAAPFIVAPLEAHLAGREGALKIMGGHIEEFRADVDRLHAEIADYRRLLNEARREIGRWRAGLTRAVDDKARLETALADQRQRADYAEARLTDLEAVEQESTKRGARVIELEHRLADAQRERGSS